MSKFLEGMSAEEPEIIDEKLTKAKSSSPFSYLDHVGELKTPIDAINLGGHEPFIFNRYLSMHHSTCEIALMATCTRNLTVEDHYRFMLSALPKKKLYIKWLNKKGEDENKKDVEAVSAMMDCGDNDAKAMLVVMSLEQLGVIKASYKTLSKLRSKYES